VRKYCYLYTLDPALKAKESELVVMINEFIAARPQVKLDSKFIKQLRTRILTKAATADLKNKANIPFINFNFIFMKKFIYSTSIGAFALVVIISGWLYITYGGSSEINTKFLAGNKVTLPLTLNKLVANSFGALNGVPASDTSTTARDNSLSQSSGETSMPKAIPSAINQTAPVIGMGGGGASGSAIARPGNPGVIMPPYEYKNYHFVFKGELSTISDKMDVLKRIKTAQLKVNMSDLVSGLNFGLMDLGTFSGLSVENISLTQSGDNGYIISLAPNEGTINIYQNWQAWLAANCASDLACSSQQKVGLSDMLSDEEIIKIADDFLAAHNIDLTNYGQPGVTDTWRQIYNATANKANFYFPESSEVIYPLKINDMLVREEYNGVKQGLSVSVSIKDKRVSSVYNLTTQNYDSSTYDMETDSAKILTYAEQGGINNYLYNYGPADNVTTEEVQLDAPELCYIRYYNYDGGLTNANTELLIPALSFPIVKPPQDMNFYRQAIIVPLAKDILSQRQADNTGGGVVKPLPVPMVLPK